MNLENAQKAVDAALKKAQELGVAISVAVVDEHGTLVALGRMDQAIKVSPKFAITKAYTAGTIGLGTGDMEAYAVPGKPYYGIESLFAGELTTIAGGLPLKKGDKLVGGIGVGGSTDTNQDVECAKAGVEAIG